MHPAGEFPGAASSPPAGGGGGARRGRLKCKRDDEGFPAEASGGNSPKSSKGSRPPRRSGSSDGALRPRRPRTQFTSRCPEDARAPEAPRAGSSSGLRPPPSGAACETGHTGCASLAEEVSGQLDSGLISATSLCPCSSRLALCARVWHCMHLGAPPLHTHSLPSLLSAGVPTFPTSAPLFNPRL